MPTSSRCAAFALIILSSFACGVAGDDDSSCTPRSAPVASNATPQEAFETARAAMQAGDWATFAAQLTPEAQNQMAGTLVMTVVMMKAMAEAFGGMAQEMADGMAEAFGDEGAGKVDVEKEMADPTAAFTALLAKHGVDEKSLEDGPQVMLGADPGAGLAMLASPIKDKSAFIVEAFEVLSASEQGKGSSPEMKGTLEDVTIDGNTATAVLVTEDGADPLEFHKIGDVWLMGLPMQAGR